MDKKNDNPLARFERRSSGYAMIIVGTVIFVCLVTAAVLAGQVRLWPIVGLIAAAFVAVIGFIGLNINRNRRLTGASERKLIKWDAAMPELQRQNVNLEVKELARLLGVDPENMSDLLSAYIVAEDLALRQIQQEEKLPLMRHVQLGSTPFDAILLEQDLITCIEVSFLVVPDVRQDKIESMLKKISLAKKNLAEMKVRVRLRLMLVLVTQLSADEEEHLRSMLITRRFTDTPVDIDIRLLDFESLQKIYVTD
ncbi:MAG: hypothetical protein KA746_12955 [Pyrinomonadaceae bacterium]|nr:hypothetical protein [Pyrinomonadaceae bacterium]MBP6213833.1 hypothetical protein [Pyrinomonadaceae bacterium]